MLIYHKSLDDFRLVIYMHAWAQEFLCIYRDERVFGWLLLENTDYRNKCDEKLMTVFWHVDILLIKRAIFKEWIPARMSFFLSSKTLIEIFFICKEIIGLGLKLDLTTKSDLVKPWKNFLETVQFLKNQLTRNAVN